MAIGGGTDKERTSLLDRLKKSRNSHANRKPSCKSQNVGGGGATKKCEEPLRGVKGSIDHAKGKNETDRLKTGSWEKVKEKHQSWKKNERS